MLKKIVVLFQLQTSESFTVYVINVNVPRVRANADKCLQHHQGCPETPKSADVICERPLRGWYIEKTNGRGLTKVVVVLSLSMAKSIILFSYQSQKHAV